MVNKTQTLDNASNAQLAEALLRLTEKNPELAEAANAELNAIAHETAKKVKASSKVEETNEKQLTPEQTKNLINTIVKRFENNMLRHETEDSRHLRSHLERKAIEKPEKIWSLNEMERTGGEPDVRCYDEERDEYVFWDFSKETPEGRKRVCYDHDAEKEAYLLYKEYITNGIEPPRGNAVDRAAAMGVELMTTEEYRTFLIMENDDSIDEFPGSWLETPAKTRRYGKAFIGQGEDDFPLDLIEPFEFLDEPGFRVTLRV